MTDDTVKCDGYSTSENLDTRECKCVAPQIDRDAPGERGICKSCSFLERLPVDAVAGDEDNRHRKEER